MVVKPSRTWLPMLHCTTTQLMSCKWWPPGQPFSPPSNGGSAPARVPCIRTPLNFPIKVVHTTSQGSLSVSHWSGHLGTTTLVVGTAECLVQVNKEILLVFCFSSTQLGCRPQGQHRTSKHLSLAAQGE